ncbi:DUF1127 domain-containing protein [Granulosicoccus sp. 3-233]|uniref:DUF1127 domain-containing protein n=1 Tax=Granulosicoccus sp. 3-233 TaxID=3417969 RepID=UPI003D33433A
MFKVFGKIASSYERYMTYRGRDIAREYLLRCDDRMLADNGFSRELLTQGVDAWPWRTMEEQEHILRATIDQASKRQAMKDLNSMSDAELHDLGITRGSIERTVMSGQPGVEHDKDLKVA